MKHAELAVIVLIGATLAPPALPQDQDPRKDATEATRQANAELLDELPFEDTTDFDNANRGLIAPLPSKIVQTENGDPVWDPQKYGFIAQDAPAPDTVNPSLWRQSQLINIGGLFEVTEGGSASSSPISTASNSGSIS